MKCRTWEIPSSISVTPRFQESTRLKWWALTIPDRPSEPASKTDGQTTIRTRLSHAGTLLFLSPRKYKLITMTDKNVDNVMSIIFKQKYAPKITKTIH